MRILLTGSSGLIGRHLQPALRSAGHEVIRLLRHRPESPEAGAILFDPANPDLALLERFDAVIHLAGENVARRWTRRRRRSILASRADFTRNLCAALARTRQPPAHFLSASGVNYYGHDASSELTESSPPGQGFLADVCRQWEAATEALLPTDPAAPRPRIALMRIAAVLTPEGGALAKLLTPFRLGLGAVMGTGRQAMSWISLPDVIAAILHVLDRPALQGPINLSSPNAVTNREFSRVLATALGRPLLLRLPAPMVKAAFGQMATETILANQRVAPQKLLESGFRFRHDTLAQALPDLLPAQA